jgi:hypothetical protein
MTNFNLPGSGNSLVGPNDDGEPTYTELMRCKHCLGEMSSKDALDLVHDDCLNKERLAWICNDSECGHSWQCFGIPAMCPVCHGWNIDNADYSRLTDLRVKIVSKRIIEERAA